MSTQTKKAYYHEGTGKGTFVLGHQFGPCLLAHETTCEDALDEWDEQFGEVVRAEDQALRDYDGETPEERIEAAMACGDIRTNSGGTTVWVDHYEWCKEFADEHAALVAFEADYPTFVKQAYSEMLAVRENT